MLKLNNNTVSKIYLNGVSCLAAYLNGEKVFGDILNTFAYNVVADGGTFDAALFNSEYNALHTKITNNGARYVLIAGAWKTNTVYALDATNGAIVRFGFARAGTATYYDKNGDMQIAASGQPRIDYHPRTLAVRGYLIEGSATNYDNNSAAFPTSTFWTSVTPNAATYKGLSYTQGVNTSISNAIKTVNGIPALAGGVTLSVHIKLVSGLDQIGWFLNRTGGTGGGLIRIAISTAALLRNDTNLTPTATSLDLGNGYYRVSIMLPGWTDGGTAILGYSGSTLLLAGHQVEGGSTISTSYIPTSGSQITRVADSTLTAESDLLNDTAATGYAQMTINRSGTTYNLIRAASSSGAIWYEAALGNQNAFARDSVTAINRNTFVTDGQSNKVITSYGSNGLRMSANGSPITNAAYSGSFGGAGQTKIFYNIGAGVVRCHVKAVAIFTSQISDSDMIAIST